MPTRFATIRGRLGLIRSAISPPITAPAPNEAPIKPHADAPPRCCLATIGPRTRNAAKPKFHKACAPRLSRYHVRVVTASRPSFSSRQKLDRTEPATRGTRSSASEIALTTKVTASMPKTQPGPNTATSTPAIAGPPTWVALRDRPISAFACWRCAALTVWGTSAPDAGVKNPSAKLYRTCLLYTSDAADDLLCVDLGGRR